MALTVAQLIEQLQKCPQDAIVEVEGCDCVGRAVSVDPDWSDGTFILIERESDGTY